MIPPVREEPMYERFAEEYAAHAAESAYNALYDRPAVLQLAGEIAGRTVLDAGCGPGLYAEEFLRRGAQVIDFDQSPTLVALARERVGAAAELRVHDLAEPLSWIPDASVDLVVLALALHYIDDRVAMLREFARVLVPSGGLVVSTTHPTADWLRLGGSYFTTEAVEGSLSPRHDWPVRAWRRPLTEVCREFAEAGFLIRERHRLVDEDLVTVVRRGPTTGCWPNKAASAPVAAGSILEADVPATADCSSTTPQIVCGLLCNTCNVGIGRADHDPKRLDAIADYLERRSWS